MEEKKKGPAAKLTIKPKNNSPMAATWPSEYGIAVGAFWPNQWGAYSVTSDKEIRLGQDGPKLPEVLYAKFGDKFYPLSEFFINMRFPKEKQPVVEKASGKDPFSKTPVKPFPPNGSGDEE